MKTKHSSHRGQEIEEFADARRALAKAMQKSQDRDIVGTQKKILTSLAALSKGCQELAKDVARISADVERLSTVVAPSRSRKARPERGGGDGTAAPAKKISIDAPPAPPEP